MFNKSICNFKCILRECYEIGVTYFVALLLIVVNKIKVRSLSPHSAVNAKDISDSTPLKKIRSTPKILLVSYYCPSRAHGGGLRILDLYALIREHCPRMQLDLLTFHRPDIDGDIRDVYDIFDNVYLSKEERLLPESLVSLSGEESCYTVIDLQFHQCGYLIDEYKKITEKIIYTPMESLAKVLCLDIQTLSFLKNGFSYKKLAAAVVTAAEEVNFLSKVDEVVCVSEADASFLRSITLLKNIRGVDTGISTLEFSDAILQNYTSGKASNRSCNVLFIAYFGSGTNIEALRWYLEEVHNSIKDSVPGYVFTIVGRGDLSSFSSYVDDSVRIIGEVPDLVPYIQDARVGIAPALSGSGFRGKVNQYAVLGVPSVISPISHKGLAYTHGENVFIAESAKDFANSCIELLTDSNLNDRIGVAAQSLCKEKYSWESKWDVIKQVYKLETKSE